MMAQSGLIGGDFPNHKSAYKYIGTETSKAMDKELGREVKVTTANFESSQGGVTVKKSFILYDGHYGITVRDTIVNNGTASVQPSIYYQLTRDSAKPRVKAPSTTPTPGLPFIPKTISSRRLTLMMRQSKSLSSLITAG